MYHEKRRPLARGMAITLKKDDGREIKFNIERVISYGENSIAYIGKICSTENSFAKRAVLKEFYPVAASYAGVYRNTETGCLDLLDNRKEDFIDSGRELFDGAFPFTGIAEGNNTIYTYTDVNEVITLREWNEDGRQLMGEDIASIMSSVCGYIQKIHDGGALYLNCNPESIYLVRGEGSAPGEAYIFDFDTVESRKTDSSHLGARADIFAAGAVFLWMLTGKNLNIETDYSDAIGTFLWDNFSMFIESTNIDIKLIVKILKDSLNRSGAFRYLHMSAMKSDFDQLVRKYAEEEGIDVRMQSDESDSKVIVMGIGGAGNSFISRVIKDKIGGLEFIAVNSDEQALLFCEARKFIQIGQRLTRGLGAGAMPETGKKAAEESAEEIREAIRGASMLFIFCGMGGGTGTGASSVVARIAKEMGICTVGFAAKPFRFEHRARISNAISGIQLLKGHTDALITISNDVASKVVDRKAEMSEALAMIDKVVLQGMLAIKNLIDPDTIYHKSLAELCNIMRGKGLGHISYSTAKGEGRTTTALQTAINSPWLETPIKDAAQVILYLYGDISEFDASDAARHIREMTGHNNVTYGARYDENKLDEVTVVVIVFEGHEKVTVTETETKTGTETKTADTSQKRRYVSKPDWLFK